MSKIKSVANTPAPRLAVGIEEAADVLGLGRSSVYKLLKERQLKGIKVGKRRLITLIELEAFLGRLQEGD